MALLQHLHSIHHVTRSSNVERRTAAADAVRLLLSVCDNSHVTTTYREVIATERQSATTIQRKVRSRQQARRHKAARVIQSAVTAYLVHMWRQEAAATVQRAFRAHEFRYDRELAADLIQETYCTYKFGDRDYYYRRRTAALRILRVPR